MNQDYKNLNKIKYTLLKDIEEPGEYNCYGIIYDASFPQYLEKKEKDNNTLNYGCTIKLIDQYINSIEFQDDATFNNNIKTLIIKSNYKEQIPFIHTIGDIIRLQHCYYSKPKTNKNIYLNFQNNNKRSMQNWCIFSGLTPEKPKNNNNNKYNNFNNTSIKPLLSSKKYYSFTEEDEIIIKELRQFIKSSLSLPKSILFYKETSLDKRLLNKENDTIVQVIYKTELDDKFIYYIQDDTDVCELHTYKYFDFIKVNDVIRVRNYKFSEKNILNTNQFSNILLIPKNLGYYNDFLDKIRKVKENLLNSSYGKNKKLLGKKINFSSKNSLINLRFKKVENSIDACFFKELNDFNANESYSLNNINIPLNEEYEKDCNKNYYLNLEEGIEEEKKLILTVINEEREIIPNINENNHENIKLINELELKDVQIIKYHPKNLNECVSFCCPDCKNSSSLDENSMVDPNKKIYCTKCRKDFSPYFYYKMIFECVESSKSNKIMILHLYTFDGEGESFFGIMPTNFKIANEQKIKLQKFLDNLIESKGYVRLYINKKSYINKNQKNTFYRIVGNYTNKIN